jgi:hypothetical protein
MVFAGYLLPPMLASLAPNFDLAKNIDKIALLVVGLSVIPIAYTVWKERKLAAAGGAKEPAKTA